MKDDFFRTENFNQEVMSKFANYLDTNELFIIKSRSHTNEIFVLPSKPEKREELLEKIVDALNDGFYSNDSCIAYIYELFRHYQDKNEEIPQKEIIFCENFDIFQ